MQFIFKTPATTNYPRLLKSCLLLAACLAGSALLGSCGFNFSGACRGNSAGITRWQQPQSKPTIYQLQGRYWTELQQSLYKPQSPFIYDMLSNESCNKWFAAQTRWELREQRQVFVQLPQADNPVAAAKQLPALLGQRPQMMPREAFMALDPKLVAGSPSKPSKARNLSEKLQLVKNNPRENELLDKFPQVVSGPQGQLSYYHRKGPGALTNLRAGVYFVTLDMPYHIVFYSMGAVIMVPVTIIAAPALLIEQRSICKLRRNQPGTAGNTDAQQTATTSSARESFNKR